MLKEGADYQEVYDEEEETPNDAILSVFTLDGEPVVYDVDRELEEK